MIIRHALAALAVAVLAVALPPAARAQDNTAAEIEKYRQALADGNPADLWEARGEAMWKEPQPIQEVWERGFRLPQVVQLHGSSALRISSRDHLSAASENSP